ncbi:MAG: ribosomal protein S19 [Candidatus Parvarchaeum acidophilus ARMAN-5]|jgi:small subunit ribosomal protein S19|uniref:Small ribosomal subunit protein uS19 n=1 Tax=Candidatus Parvarchaeum acidophilus ARMAN-5 TaxID=662762 RepID=D6GW05_PARA5|nr:MAG: ribosomal protein S19 [Candidatus Parvarchaeum acidophilus ARMAN-5]
MEDYKFRGKSIDELKQMSNEDLAKIANADFRRVIKRGFSPEEKLFLSNLSKKAAKSKPIKTHMREMFILPNFVGLTIHVHNGKEFIPLEIKPSMVFHRLGEFALSTKQVKHGSPGMKATRSSGFVPIK